MSRKFSPVLFSVLSGGRPAGLRALALGLALVPAAAWSQVDLAPLFASPTPLERAFVQAEWRVRDPVADSYESVRTGQASGFTFEIVRHRVEGNWHYGVIRYPRLLTPGGSYPVLLFQHGGHDGFDTDYLATFDADFPGTCLPDSFFVVAPTYRSETFFGGSLGLYTSEGEPSLFDRDADDAIALLDAVLQNIPETDASRVAGFGRSRGGNVAYHVAIRDPRVHITAILFGPTDFLLPSIESDAEAIINNGETIQGTIIDLVMEKVVNPYLAGALSLADARRILLRWSPVYFLTAALSFQVHHGVYDDTVPIVHSERVAEVMADLGVDAPRFEFFVYPSGGHSSASLTGYELRVEPYLCGIIQGGTGVGDDALPVAAVPRLWNGPNPFSGRTELVFQLPGTDDPSVQSASRPVTLDIYDLAGRLVRSLVHQELPGGEYRRPWDGNDARGRPAAQGTYMARLRAGSQLTSHKLVLLR